MKIPHENFCVLPWISLEASPMGTVRPCCLSLDEIVDEHGDKYRLGEVGLDEIQQSHFMRDLRQQFLDGKKPQTCKRCWTEERAGRTSKRMHTLARLENIVNVETWNQSPQALYFLDLKLGNICNLKCRICASWSSSSFATEELAYTQPDERKQSFAYVMNQQGAWPRTRVEFWQDLKQHYQGLRYIEFTGGEPFMIGEHFDLLEDLAGSGHAANIEIHYNTNGTQWPERAQEIWSHFKHVEIAFSIDDIGSRFEYQRSNADWSSVCSNLNKFYQLRDETRNISLQICCTINVFNVFYIDEVAAWISQQPVDFVYWNMLHDAYYFSISTLPDTAKQQIAHKLQHATIPSKFREEFNRVIDFMLNGVSLDGQILRMKLRDLDFKRKQQLGLVMPELARVLDYEYSQ